MVQDMLRGISEQITTMLRRRPPPEPPPQFLPLSYGKCVELHSIQYHCSITLCRMKNSVFPSDKCEVGSLRYIEDDMVLSLLLPVNIVSQILTFVTQSSDWFLRISKVLVGQRRGGGPHRSQGGRLNLRTEIPKLNLEDKVDFKGRALIQSHTPQPPPPRSSAVKDGFKGFSDTAQEL